MNRLSIRVLLIAALVTFSGTSFSNKATVTATSPKQGILYYWYAWPYDVLDNRKTAADKMYELWVLYGVNVDQSPSGGTLLSKGYFNNAWPHNQQPMMFLYGHFYWLQ